MKASAAETSAPERSARLSAVIRPSEAARARSGAGKDQGSSSVVYLDPNLSNKSFVVRDKDGNELASPVFLILGHELVHAIHNQDGDNDAAASGSAGYPNKEEEETIGDRHDMTENALRREHGLGVRSGHWARDTGHRSATVSGGATGG